MATLQQARARLVYPLDVPDLGAAREAIIRVEGAVGVLKVGLELFVGAGPAAVALAAENADVFLDLKLHDIPATVARAVTRAGQLGARYLTIHAAGGPAMMRAAAEAAAACPRPLTLLAVTMLTSLDGPDLVQLGIAQPPSSYVTRLAQIAYDCGVRGFVSAASEVFHLRTQFGDATLVTPGIRPAGANPGDQKRVATPAAAIRAGSDLLVVGRPIRDSDDPGRAARAIVEEIREALNERTA